MIKELDRTLHEFICCKKFGRTSESIRMPVTVQAKQEAKAAARNAENLAAAKNAENLAVAGNAEKRSKSLNKMRRTEGEADWPSPPQIEYTEVSPPRKPTPMRAWPREDESRASASGTKSVNQDESMKDTEEVAEESEVAESRGDGAMDVDAEISDSDMVGEWGKEYKKLSHMERIFRKREVEEAARTCRSSWQWQR